MAYVDGEWQHIDNTWSDSGFGGFVYDEEAGEYESSMMTYEEYLENKELQEAYTWEEVQAAFGETATQKDFDAWHPYYCISSLLMGADHIAREVEGVAVK